MQNYKESFHYNFFVGSGKVLTNTAKSTADLAPLQLGLFNSKNYQAIAPGTSTSKVYEILIAMGSPNDPKIDWENANVSFKSVPIQANRLISWRKALPKKALNHVVTIGWDGVTDCKTITAECGKTYSLHVEIQGSPASRYFGSKPLTQRFVYTFADCGADCVADVEKMVDSFVLQINSDKQISPFAHAEKIVDYNGTDPVYTTVGFTKYTLTKVDEGSLQDLSDVQAFYEAENEEYLIRKSRTGITSVYEILIPTADGAPAAWTVPASRALLSDCTCPSGYALVDVAYKFKIERQDLGTAANLTTIRTVYSDAGAFRLSYEGGVSTYVVHSATAAVPTPSDSGAAGAGDIKTAIGQDEAYCELDEEVPTTIAWVSGGTMYKIQKDVCTVIGDQPCDDGEDAALDAALNAWATANGLDPADFAVDASGVCANAATGKVWSELMEDGCGIDVAVFKDLPTFKGFRWADCPCETVTPHDIKNIGIRLTGAYVDTQFSQCAFEYDDFVELDLPRILVRQGESIVEIGACNNPWDVTTIQFPQYPTGNGTNVKKQYIEAMNFKHQLWADTPRWREIFGFNYDFIDVKKAYKFFYLEFEAIDKYTKNTGYGGMDIRTTITFAFPEDADTSAFETLIESWISSTRPDLISADTTLNLLR